MEITEDKKENCVLFTLKGRLDSTTSPEVETKIIDSVSAGNKEILLDFSGLEYLSSAGIRALVHCHKKIEHEHGHIFLIAIPKPIENVLYITGFLPYFQVFDSEAKAINALNS